MYHLKALKKNSTRWYVQLKIFEMAHFQHFHPPIYSPWFFAKNGLFFNLWFFSPSERAHLKVAEKYKIIEIELSKLKLELFNDDVVLSTPCSKYWSPYSSYCQEHCWTVMKRQGK